MRYKTLMDDTGDIKVHRDMQLGHAEFNENVPMFFNQYRMPLNIEGLFKGRSCFLFSNGPSASEIRMARLKKPGVQIMSVNNGASTLLANGITPDFWVCVDQPCRFVKQIWLNPKIMKFVPFSCFDKPLWDNETWKPLDMLVKDAPNVIGYMRNEKFAAHRFWTESNFNWGCHKKYGGCRTVLLPAMRIPFILGFRELYLIGVDLKMDDTKKYHFDEGRNKGAIKCNTNTYKRIINEYGPGLEKYSKQVGYKIYNCNPNSALDCFDFMHYKEAISKATSVNGPLKQIQTRGMYTVWKDKIKMTREQAIEKTT